MLNLSVLVFMVTTKQNALMRHIAKIIHEQVERHMYSRACVECGPNDKFFDDSCQYVELVAALNQFATFLENYARYNEILEK